ncbi:ROK family glucokinase [Stackebrandtia nassauensis]|uniref:Glucokinase n=1 Tax=Stackebrandtia nassauensis (strain DSM 44728 / CIP 108903 / NRRL B-16338 / NBRC 102104 / LLR-40K-21) TaxID=446470 RepID=D3Q8R5_STANL|nr:ROK family glucokinase [Stackebrandtia nassauensis]ADD44507.1 glucokinase, ROK family [Stackebrandtia nassauensis DSM 44728]
MTLAIGIDIGGTKVLGGVVDPEGKVLASTLRPSPAQEPVKIREVVTEIIEDLRRDHEVSAIGVGAAGWIDEKRSTVLFAPNLAWRNEPLRDGLMSNIDIPVVVENDANVATWAEFRFGAGRKANSAVLFTVGTGIGGGIVLEGNLVRGAHGIAAEFGHTLAVPGGITCGCGRSGCLEQYASGSALVRVARRAALDAPGKARKLLEAADANPAAITGPMVTQAARDGDPVAIAAFDEIGGYLGEALADMIQLFDPDVAIIGGGVIKAGELLLKPARDRFEAVLHARGQLPVGRITAAEMGPEAGIIGAADLARR